MAGFKEILENAHGRFSKQLVDLIRGLHRVLGEQSLLAYLVGMSLRLVEVHRVLKETGSFYLHCDPTASHYLKIVSDAIFGTRNYRSELIWKRSSAHSGSRKYSPVHDTLLFYTKGDNYTWNTLYQPLPQTTADAWYNNVEEGTMVGCG